jgi:hypothetical protein
MQSRKWLMAGILVLIVAMLAGCGDRGSGKMRTGQQDLEKFANKLTSLNVYEQLGLVHMASGAGEDTVYLQVRKKDDFVKPVMESEKEEIKEAIFHEIGYRVPLDLQVYTIDEIPHIVGKLTAVEGDRLLIVEDRDSAGQDEGMPRAMWFKMAEDAVIAKDGERIAAEDLKIGYEVNGWHSGLVMESYPEQTDGLKIVVTGPGTSETGELTGTLEEISYGHADWTQNYAVVDGKKYGLSGSSVVWINGERKTVSDLKPGDRVLLWFTGYSVGLENEPKMVTQIAVVR